MTMLKRRCSRHCFAFLVLLSRSESVRCFAVPAGHNQQNLPFRSLARNRAVPPPTPPRGYLDQLKQVSAASTEAEGGDPDSSLTNPEASLPLTPGNTAENLETPGFWPTFDALDTRLIKISLPVIANFAINPLVGAVDLFWVNRMGNVLAVAGQSAANQVFNSVFWLTSFLPAVSATIIAQENAKGNKEGVQDAVCNALFVGLVFAALSSSLLLLHPGKILSSVLEEGAPALAYAKPYLFIRAFASLPSIISLVGFSAFRGVQDTVTPVKISSFANVFNAVLDPILIFTFAMGVSGAALATLAAEVVSAVTYLYIMRKRKMIRFSKIFSLPKWSKLSPLLRGGLALQLRNVALNVAFLLVARTTQTIDPTGVAAAAHALSIQTFQIGGIVLLALSSVSQTVVPNDLEVGGKRKAKSTVNRLMSWGFILGTLLGGLQLALLPVITMSTPIPEVREAARMPAILASIYQVINGMVFIGEGVMIGTGSFLQLSLGTVVATAGLLWAIRVFPAKYGLTGIWIGFGVFNAIRLLGVIIHQFMNGPLAARNMKKEKETP
jgi:MATE family multidrug resistance protein